MEAPITVSVKETAYCQLAISCTAGPEAIEAKRKEVLKQFKNAPVPGNRPGKASTKAIEMHYSKQVNESLKRAMLEECYHEAIFAEKIQPFGQPNVTSMLLLADRFTCDFTLNKKPDFELSPYKGMEVPKQPVAKSIEDIVQESLQAVRIQHGTSIPYTEDDFVQTGDNVILNYQAFDGETLLDALKADGDMITIGQSNLHGFDDNMLGMKADDEREFFLHIPETGLPSVAGKDIRFQVKLLTGSKNLPAALDDELAKKFNKANYLELVEAVTKHASMQHDEMQRQANMQQVNARLIANNQIKVPHWLTISEAQYLATNAKLDWNSMQDVDKEQFLKTAEGNVKMALVLDKIRSEEPEAQLSDQEVLEMISRTYSQQQPDKNPDEVLATLNQNGYLNILVARLRDEYVLDFIMKQTTFTE